MFGIRQASVVVYQGNSVLFEESGFSTGDAQRRKQALERQYPRSAGYAVIVHG